jgi:hypothetical protein
MTREPKAVATREPKLRRPDSRVPELEARVRELEQQLAATQQKLVAANQEIERLNDAALQARRMAAGFA